MKTAHTAVDSGPTRRERECEVKKEARRHDGSSEPPAHVTDAEADLHREGRSAYKAA
jgi:hypothetical protein